MAGTCISVIYLYYSLTMRFKASVQYGDFQGTAAADRSDQADLNDLLQKRKLIREDEHLIAASFYPMLFAEERFRFSVTAYLFKGEWDQARSFLNESLDETLPVRIVRLDISAVEFFLLWKRFEVVLTSRNLPLEGREYTEIENEAV